MIRYPQFQTGARIGVTAPSSGVPKELHSTLELALERLTAKDYQMVVGETVWTQDRVRSARAMARAAEFNAMLQNPDLDLILPPWGGELAIEILDLIDFDQISPKWVMGYSDISLLLLAITLKTGLATAHGTNLVDLRGDYADDTTAKWEEVLQLKQGASIEQVSSAYYQAQWDHSKPSPCVFNLTELTRWRAVEERETQFSGRLLGGCIDVIRHLIGTPFGDVTSFRETFIAGEPIVWFLENCELTMPDLKRTLVQMKLAGWFDHCSGILFGRSPMTDRTAAYADTHVYLELAEELDLPILYDIDCGHQPPQLTLINGAWANVTYAAGKGKVEQTFKP